MTQEDVTDLIPKPRANSQLIGHESAEQVLLDAFNSERLHHAWLICGPKGIGKATLAFRFARFLLSQPPEGNDSGLFGNDLPPSPLTSLDVPPENPVFHRVAANGHADLMTIERAYDDKKERRKTEIAVGDVRGVGGFLAKTAAEGGWRIVVIDAADEMNRNAANAVLKILEEPPKKAILLLVCHNPGRLLPTIRSRCRKLVLNPLADPQVSELIHRYRPDISVPDTQGLAILSEGSIGRALSLAEEGGLDFYKDLLDLLGTLPKLDTGKLHGLSDRLAARGGEASFVTVMDLLKWWLGRLIRFGAAGSLESPAVLQAEIDLYQRLLGLAGLDRWLEVWEKVSQLISRAGGGAQLDRKQVVLNAFLAIEATARR